MSTENSRAARAAQSVLLFRAVNEQILGFTERLASLLTDIDIVCECADPSCVGTVHLPTSTFAGVRESDAAFIVLPGHERRDLEEVVAREENYVVVRKDPEVVADVASP